MKISVITCSYNSGRVIRSAIESVLAQNYPYIEYIVIDGASKDNTFDIISEYSSNISKLISEPDKGIYDAINKGIKTATGDVIGLLHSDDFFADKNALSKIAEAFENTKVDAVYGDLEYVKEKNTDQRHRIWKSGEYKEGKFLKGWMPPHPTFYLKKELYEKHGLYNTDFSISADYELMLRMVHKHKINLQYIPEVLVKMRAGGKSNVSLKNRLQANKEDRIAWKVNGLKPTLFTTIKKPLSKIGQFFS